VNSGTQGTRKAGALDDVPGYTGPHSGERARGEDSKRVLETMRRFVKQRLHELGAPLHQRMDAVGLEVPQRCRRYDLDAYHGRRSLLHSTDDISRAQVANRELAAVGCREVVPQRS